jgi:hypothetical protein
MRLRNVGILIGSPKKPGKTSLIVETLYLMGICGSGFVLWYLSERIPTMYAGMHSLASRPAFLHSGADVGSNTSVFAKV